jgi:uncharacterized protein YeaO (DUF488 family)
VAKAEGIPLIDTTFAAQPPYLSPTREIVMNYKGDRITEAEYTTHFISILAQRQIDYPVQWTAFLQMEEVCVACYCKAGKFCHRHLLIEIIRKRCELDGIPFEHMGEITKEFKREQAYTNKENTPSIVTELPRELPVEFFD